MSENTEVLKALPSSEDTEKALLGCSIIGGDKEAEITMAWIRNDDAFYTTKNKQIWKAIKYLYKNLVPFSETSQLQYIRVMLIML